MFASYAVFLIPIVAILAWGVHRAVHEIYDGRAKVAQAGQGQGNLQRSLDETAMVNKQVLAKLESLEARLVNVEKTLNDIPS